MKQYTIMGNKKKITSISNYDQINVVGNHCTVVVAKNLGSIDVVGNHCRIEVEENCGSISLTGSHGVIFVRRRSKGDVIQLTGTSCRLLLNDTDESSKGYEAQISPFTATMDALFNPIFNFGMR